MDRLIRRQRAVPQKILQRTPVHIFHDDIEKSGSGIVFHIHDGNDVRMLNPRSDPGFPHETFRKYRIVGDFIRPEQFQRTVDIQLLMKHQVHFAHAPDPEATHYLIFADHIARL